MFATTRRLALAAALTLPALFAAAPAARAGDEDYAVVSFKNDTNAVVTYQLKWGGGEWKAFTVSPGKRIRHTLDVTARANPAQRRSAPFIAFTDMKGNDVSMKLHAELGDGTGRGNVYTITPTNNGNNFALFGSNR